MTDPTQSVTSFDIIGPSDSKMAIVGSDLTETSTELLFKFQRHRQWLSFVSIPDLVFRY